MLVEHLKSELSDRSRKNPRYSMRAFAKALKISPGTLSAILNKKRALTPKTATKLLAELGLKPMECRKLMMSAMGMPESEKEMVPALVLEGHILEVITGWEHFAILALVDTKGFKPNAAWIAARLNTNTGTVLPAIERLEKVGLLEKRRNKWTVVHKNLSTSIDIPSSALRRVHREYIEKSIYSLENHSTDQRDVSGITMAISKNKLPQAKKMIQEFRRNLCQFLEDGEKEEVYRLNIQLFPMGR